MSEQSESSGTGAALGRRPLRHARHAALALALATTLAAAAFFGLELKHARERAILEGEQQGRTLAGLLERQTAHSVRELELALRGLADRLAAMRSGQETDQPTAEDLLRREAAAIGPSRAILLVDRAGRPIGSSDSRLTARIDPGALADIEGAPGMANLRLAAPVTVGSEWLIPVKADAPGPAAETLVALIHPDHFEQVFRMVEIGAQDSIALYATSGHLMACHPACPGAIGRAGVDTPLLRDWLARADQDTIRETDRAGGLARVVSYRRVAGHPLVLVLSLGGDGVVAEWRREARSSLLAGAALLIVVAGLSALLYQQLRRREAIRAALQESEAQFRIVADTMPVPLWTCDAAGALTLLNRAWLGFTGRTMEEQRGEGWKSGIHPEDLPGLTAAYRQALRGRAPYTRDYRLRGADGQYRWFHDAALPRFGPDGTFLGLTGTLQDITERRRAEKALADSERRFRNLLQNMRNIIFCSGVKGGGGHGYEGGRPRIYGADAQRIAGTVEGGLANVALWYESVLPEDRPAYFEAERRRKELGEGYTLEYRFRHPITGELKWARETGWVVKDEESGETCFDSFILEITDEKRAAEELRRNQALLRAVLDAVPASVNVRDREGHHVLVNQYHSNFYGRPPEWFIGKTIGEALSPDNAGPVIERDRKFLEADGVAAMVEEDHVGPNGRITTWLGTKAPVRDPDGAIRYIVSVGVDITERKRAEQAMRESQNLLRAVIDAVPASINVKTVEGRYVLVNAFHKRFHDRPPDWFIDKTPAEVVGGEYAREVMERDRRLVETGEAAMIFEEEYEEPGGRLGVWLTTKAPVRNAEGQITHVVTVGFDITERKKAEAARREIEARLVAFMHYAPFSMFIKDVQGRYVMINREGERLFRASKDVVVGKTTPDFFPADMAASYAAHDHAVLESGTVVARESRNSEGDAYPWSLAIKFPIRDDRGVIAAVGGFELDITEKKRAEEALRESEQRFRSMADTVPALVWMSDKSGQCIFVNRRWLEYTGRAMEQELGRGYVENIHPEDRTEVLEFERRAHDQRSLFMKDYRLRGGDGEYRWFLDTGAARFTPDGTYLGHIGLLVDINDRRRLELELEQARRIDAIGQLTGGVAHDFNNLLTVILGNTEMLLGSLDPDTRSYTLARLVRLAALRGEEITQRLLAFGRRQALQPTEIDLNRLVRGLKDLLRRTLGDEVAIEIELADRIWIAHADPLQVENALLNLALNARDAMPKGGTITIRTGNHTVEPDSALARDEMQPGDYVGLSVTDTGAGMSREVAERAFEPFFTTKGMGKGTGLGLSTVYGFAKQSGGHAVIESVPGRGTTVSVFLPRTSEELRDFAEAELTDAAAPGDGQKLGWRRRPTVGRIAGRENRAAMPAVGEPAPLRRLRTNRDFACRTVIECRRQRSYGMFRGVDAVADRTDIDPTSDQEGPS